MGEWMELMGELTKTIRTDVTFAIITTKQHQFRFIYVPRMEHKHASVHSFCPSRISSLI